MKRIFKISVSMLFVFICAGSLFAQQSSSDPTANSSSAQTNSESQALPQQSPDASVVATPTTTSAPAPDTQAVSSGQTSQPVASPAPVSEPVQQPVSSTPSASSAQAEEESIQPIQKDDKKSLTVMTSDIPSKDIEKKDWLSEVFTPVGDFTFNVVKTSSDALGGFCQGCVDAFDGITKAMLTPFGFKEEPKEKRTY